MMRKSKRKHEEDNMKDHLLMTKRQLAVVAEFARIKLASMLDTNKVFKAIIISFKFFSCCIQFTYVSAERFYWVLGLPQSNYKISRAKLVFSFVSFSMTGICFPKFRG